MKTSIQAVIALALCAVAPLPSRADERPNRDNKNYQVVSFDEQITSFDGKKGSLDGNVVLAGKYNDKGTRHEDFTVVGANKDGSEAYITITGTITASQGTMTLTAIGTIHFTSQGFYYVEGPESIVGGTGAYANSRGKGSFIATQDNTAAPAPRVVGTFEALMSNP
ncbi:MAG: hypothetical protein M3Z64_09360 [Verrucomicrobiota bacterium]|nr:hypothetical protein [Verrucomicrobiota bacterium]